MKIKSLLLTLWLLATFQTYGKIESINSNSSDIQKKNVKVTFIVIVPQSTPKPDKIYLMGSMNNWDPGNGEPPDSTDIILTKREDSPYVWETVLELPPGNKYQYKYTRGSLESREVGADSNDIPNRSFFTSTEVDPVIKDTVARWWDFSQPVLPQNLDPILSFANDSVQTSISITWASEEYGKSYVMYGINNVDEFQKEAVIHKGLLKDNDELIHSVVLYNLKPETEYKYKVITEGFYESDIKTFKTADFSKKYTFILFGDNRPGVDTLVLRQVINLQPAFVLHTGDLVQWGTSVEFWYQFIGDYKDLLGISPWLPVYGNHEAQAYLNKFFYLPDNYSENPENKGHWYSVDYKNLHIIGLDVYRDFTVGSEQRQWLINDLENRSKETYFTVVMFHEPPFSSGRYGGNEAVKTELVPIFEQYKVDLVFCGHEHLYERSVVNNIQYITSGGAGSVLYVTNPDSNKFSVFTESVYHFCKISVDNAVLKLEMIRNDGTLGDSFTLDKSNLFNIPYKYELKQNYPNPFNGQTTIEYSVPARTFVTIRLYDALGQLVTTLVNREHEQGTYKVKLDAADLVSGVYFYSLRSDNKMFVKKLMLIK